MAGRAGAFQGQALRLRFPYAVTAAMIPYMLMSDPLPIVSWQKGVWPCTPQQIPIIACGFFMYS